jgi:hypothetical protein
MGTVTGFDGAWQEESSETDEDVVLLIDSAAIDPASWMRVALHAPSAPRAWSRRGAAHAAFGWCMVPAAPPPRGIPPDRIIRMPHAPLRVRHLPSPGAGQTGAGYAAPRRRWRRLGMLPGIARRHGRTVTWTLLVVWLVGAWGMFFGVSGGLDVVPRGKTVLSHAASH